MKKDDDVICFITTNLKECNQGLDLSCGGSKQKTVRSTEG